jgi:hypothetical protein
MKQKKSIGFIVVLAIAVLAAVNVYINNCKSNLSDLALANVEALAIEIPVMPQYPTITCIAYCNWVTSYNCALYQNGSYIMTCVDFRGW